MNWENPELQKEAERLFVEMQKAGAQPMKLLPIVRKIGAVATSDEERLAAVRKLHAKIVRNN